MVQSMIGSSRMDGGLREERHGELLGVAMRGGGDSGTMDMTTPNGQ